MKAFDKVQSWHDDSETHAVVWCGDWTPLSRGLETLCELCGRSISAFPVVLEKKALLPDVFHIVCRAKCMAIVLKFGQVPFGGRISGNTLPESLEKFGRKDFQ